MDIDQLIDLIEHVINGYADGYDDLNDLDTRDLAENIALQVDAQHVISSVRDQVLSEAAAMIVADYDRQLWATKPGRHWAAALLLAARTNQED